MNDHDTVVNALLTRIAGGVSPRYIRDMKGWLRNGLVIVVLSACGGDQGPRPRPDVPTRAFRMGFSSFPPRFS